jgi:hypothetical protein
MIADDLKSPARARTSKRPDLPFEGALAYVLDSHRSGESCQRGFSIQAARAADFFVMPQ